MASSYTTNSGIEKPAEGDQTGEWGDTVNTNMDIIDRSINGVGAITLSGTTHTLTTTDGTLSDGMYKVLVLGGSPSGTNTITIAPNSADKVYIVVNGSGQTATFTQGSGGNVSVLNGDSKIIYADGNGTGAAVVDVTADLSFSSVNIDGGTIDGTVIGGASAAAGTFTTVTASGEIDGASLDISGNADIDGTLETDALSIASTTVTSTAAELNYNDTGAAVGTVVASKTVTADANKDVASFRNITLTGELDAGSLDISGDADIDGTLEADAMTLNGTAITTTATLSTGISNTNVPVFTSGVADDDFLRVAGTSIEGRSAAEVLSDIGASAAAGSGSIVTTGALDSGSITSGFGTINNGSSAITTTGLISGGSLDIDDVVINGSTIGHTDDTDLITVADGIATVAGEVSMTTLDIGGTNVTSTAAELNYLDITTLGTTQASKAVTTDSNGDVLFPDGDTIKLGNGADLQILHDGGNSKIIDSGTGDLLIAADNNITFTNAAVNENKAIFTTNGAVTLYYDNAVKFVTTATGADITGAATASTFEPDSDTAAGDNAAIGYTSAEGLILTGQGSTSDITFKNDADASVFSIPTGTTTALMTTTSELQFYTSAYGIRASTGLEIKTGDFTRFLKGTTEYMRILSGGAVIVAGTSAYSDGTFGEAKLQFNTVSGSHIGACSVANTNNSITHLLFKNVQGAVGSIGTHDDDLLILTGNNERVRITNGGTVDIAGVATAATFEPDGDTAAGDNAAIGYTSAEGLILTGQGSTSDVTIKNDADAEVLAVPTGTTTGKFAGNVIIAGDDSTLLNAVGSTAKLVVTGSTSNTNTNANSDASIVISNTDQTAGNTSGLHFARADTDDTPNYAGASIVGQFPETQATGQYPKGLLAFLTSTAANTAPSEKMRIGADGNVGIGTTAASTYANSMGNTLVVGTGNNFAVIQGRTDGPSGATNGVNYGGSYASNPINGARMFIGAAGGAGQRGLITFNTKNLDDATSQPLERMRIDAAGIVQIAQGSASPTTEVFRIGTNSVGSVPVMTASFPGNAKWLFNTNDTAGQSGGRHHTYFSNGGEVGSVTTTTSATAFNTGSDYRLKENVSYTFDATTRLKQLKPARFNFKVNADSEIVDGFLAHEVSSIVPEAITGAKDAVDGDGNPVYQSIDQSKLVPLLVKTIQELEARITALEAG